MVEIYSSKSLTKKISYPHNRLLRIAGPILYGSKLDNFVFTILRQYVIASTNRQNGNNISNSLLLPIVAKIGQNLMPTT